MMFHYCVEHKLWFPLSSPTFTSIAVNRDGPGAQVLLSLQLLSPNPSCSCTFLLAFLAGAVLGDALAQRSQEQSCIPVQNLCECLELLSPTTKQEMLPAVQELTCLKVVFLSKAFMTLGGGINLILGKLRLVLYGQNTCHVFTTDLSGTERMNQASDCWQTTLAKVAEGLIFKVTSLY